MIYGQLSQFKTYAPLGEGISKAFDFLLSNPVSQMADQRYEIDGDSVFAIISTYETKPKEAMELEAHRRYIDLQYLIDGNEQIYVGFLNEMQIKTPYNDDTDIAFYQGDAQALTLGNDRFLLLWPEDVHAPGIRLENSTPVRKVVVKIHI